MKKQNLDFEVTWDFLIEMEGLYNSKLFEKKKKIQQVGFCDFIYRSFS